MFGDQVSMASVAHRELVHKLSARRGAEKRAALTLGITPSVNRPRRVRYNFVSFIPTDVATFVRILQTSDALFIDATGRLAVGFPLANACVPLFPRLSLFRSA